MTLETTLTLGLAAVTVGLYAFMVLVAVLARRQPPGVAARLICPETQTMTDVRIGKDRTTDELAVLWCERFAPRPVGCRQECFINTTPD